MSNRREFIKIGSLAGLAILAGCPVTQSSLEALIAEIAAAWAKLSPYVTSTDPALAVKITAEIIAVQAAIQGWKPGMSITDIESVINILVSSMNLIPVIAQYEPLVALIVATAEGILALLPNGTPNVMVNARGVAFANPPRTARQFKKEWNKTVNAKALPAKLEIQ